MKWKIDNGIPKESESKTPCNSKRMQYLNARREGGSGEESGETNAYPKWGLEMRIFQSCSKRDRSAEWINSLPIG